MVFDPRDKTFWDAAALDTELRTEGQSGIDELTRRLMRREKVSLAELSAEVAKLEGHPSKLLAGVH